MADDRTRNYGRMIARAWSDPEFAERLKNDPAAALAEAGIEIPEGMKVTSYFAAENEVVVLVPARPSEELSDEALEAMAGGSQPGTTACPPATYGTGASTGSAT